MPNKEFSKVKIIKIILQLLQRLKHLHKLGFVHGDLKLHNFCFGKEELDKDNIVYLIDFGSSFKIWDKEGKHKKFCTDKKFVGNLMFASVNICKGAALSRRDDIESLIYILAYLLNNHRLPWSRW